MISCRYRLGAAFAVFSLVVATPAAASIGVRISTPSTASPVHLVGTTGRVSGRHRLSAHQWVLPLVSTADTTGVGHPYAVFSRRNVTPGRGVDPAGTLLAVTKSRHVKTLGVLTSDMGTFSLSGSTLTAPSRTRPSTVYWWRDPYAARPASTSTVPGGRRYLTSAPDGWIEVDGDGTLYDENVMDGHANSLGHPFAAMTDHDVAAVSGPSGVVVWNDSQIAFISFATRDVTPLDTSPLTDISGGTNSPQCWSVSTTAAACGSYYFDGEDESGIKNVFIDPLSGESALATSTACPAVATALGATVAWAGCNEKLTVMSSTGTTKTKITAFSPPVAGLGDFLTTKGGKVGIGVSPHAFKTSTVLPAYRAVSEASAFALTAGTIYWKQDDAGPAPHHIVVKRRSVGVNRRGTGVTAGHVKSVGTSPSAQVPLAASGSTVAYSVRNTSSSLGEHAAAALRIVSPKRNVTIHGVDRYLPVSIADHRLLYFTGPDHARLYNIRSRSTRRISMVSGALSSHYFAYATNGGRLRLKDFTTGHVDTVATGQWTSTGAVTVFLYHRVVGWTTVTSAGRSSQYRNTGSTASVEVVLPKGEQLWAMSRYGAVILAAPKQPTTKYLLRPYSSNTAKPLLSQRWPAVAGPQIAGRLIGWIDDEGHLKVSALG